MPSGVIVRFERGQHFGDVSDRKNQFAVGAVIFVDHHLSGDLRHAFAIANPGLEIAKCFGVKLRFRFMKQFPRWGKIACARRRSVDICGYPEWRGRNDLLVALRRAGPISRSARKCLINKRRSRRRKIYHAQRSDVGRHGRVDKLNGVKQLDPIRIHPILVCSSLRFVDAAKCRRHSARPGWKLRDSYQLKLHFPCDKPARPESLNGRIGDLILLNDPAPISRLNDAAG